MRRSTKFFSNVSSGSTLSMEECTTIVQNSLKTLSLEEEAQALQEADAIMNSVDNDIADMETSSDQAAILEDVAVTADSVEEATPAETQLVEMVGDMVVAGDPVTPGEEVVPSMEGYIGKKIATEGLREKANQIFETIVKYLKDLWARIENFFHKYFSAIGMRRRILEGTLKYLDAINGKALKADAKVVLKSGHDTLIVNGQLISSEAEYKAALEKLTAAVKFVYGSWPGSVSAFGEAISKTMTDFNPANPGENLTGFAKKIAETGKAIPTNVFGSKQKSWISGFETKRSDPFFANQSLWIQIPEAGSAVDENKSIVGQLNHLQYTGVELRNTTDNDPRIDPTKNIEFKPFSVDGMREFLRMGLTIVDEIDGYDRGSARKGIDASKKKIDDSYRKMKAALDRVSRDNDGDSGAVPYYRALMNYSIAYARWVQQPIMRMTQLAMTVVRQLCYICNISIMQYKGA